jgi:hypothetical protein
LAQSAKHAGGPGVTAVSGITGDHNRLAKHLADPAQFATKENITTIDGVKSVIKPDIAAKNVPEEISEFQKAFNAVLKDAGSKQLLVLRSATPTSTISQVVRRGHDQSPSANKG